MTVNKKYFGWEPWPNSSAYPSPKIKHPKYTPSLSSGIVLFRKLRDVPLVQMVDFLVGLNKIIPLAKNSK